MADTDTVKPTPTQEENDRTASGEHVIDHEHDGSPPDPGIPQPPDGGGGPDPEPEPDPKPTITSLEPPSSDPPSVAPLKVHGANFTSAAKVWFNGTQRATTYRNPTQVDASVSGGTAGTFDVFVRDAAGDSNIVQFTFTAAAAAAATDEPTRTRRR